LHASNFKRWGLSYLAAVVLTGFPIPPLQAQSIPQTIQGLVTDQSEAVVLGATVTITNVATGISATTLTNETGNYTFPLVDVGNYDIACSLEGFQPQRINNQRVDTGAQVRADFQLEIGEATFTIEVEASAVVLDTENATMGAVVENKRIVELPLNGRNMVQLAVLVPGVQFGHRGGLANGLGRARANGPIPGQVYSISANGVRELHQVVSLDGLEAKDPLWNRTHFVPSIEAIEEFKVQTNTYSAEVGFGGGAVTSITMKSGTNQLHGTLFAFLRNDKLDAENYFLNFERVGEREPKDKLRRNQFGAVVSGPIVKNKTFWMFNWESRRERLGVVQGASFPIDDFRNGNFSELLTDKFVDTGRIGPRSPILIYDALTGDPFPNNIIPSSQIHPGAKNVMEQFIPRADFRETDPLLQTARSAVDEAINTNLFFGRVDHHFSDTNRFFARLAWDESGRDRETINPNFPRFTRTRAINLATSWVHTFNQNAINDFRFGFNITDDESSNARTNDESFDMDALGVGRVRVAGDGNRSLTPLEHGVPNFGGLGFPLTDDGPAISFTNSFQFADHLSIVRGSHNLKFGGEYHRISLERGGSNAPRGRLIFGPSESGLPFASYLLGRPFVTLTAEGAPFSFPQANRLGFYVHDDWKVSPKLTVNLGLRVDYNGNPTGSQGHWRTLNFCGEEGPQGRGPDCYTDPENGLQHPTVGPEFIDERGGVKLWKQDFRFFMPRVGIAYRPSHKWVVRAGAGYFDNLMHMNNFTVLNLMPPKSGSNVFFSATQNAQTVSLTTPAGRTFDSLQTLKYRPGLPIITLDDPFLEATGGAPADIPVNLTHIKPDYKDGDVWKWSFDIQRELPANLAFTVGYVGSKASRVANSIYNWNSPDPTPGPRFDQSKRPWQRFYDSAQPEKGLQTLGQVRYLDSYGNSFHHGLQAKLDKRYTNGLALGVAYTFSKSHGDGEAGGNEGAQFQAPRTDRRNARGRFRFDQRHNLVAHYVWEIPGANLDSPLRHVIGGWQTNGVLSLRSGFPFTVRGRPDDLNVENPIFGVRPDLVGEPRLSNPTRKLWFDPQAFSRNTCRLPERLDLCHIGTAGYNILDSPGQKNLDFSLYKNFSVSESTKLQFRAEFFNAFNTPYFGEPEGITFPGFNRRQLTPNGPRDGEIRELRTPMRIIQFGLKLFF
jgi:hypothetical protein